MLKRRRETEKKGMVGKKNKLAHTPAKQFSPPVPTAGVVPAAGAPEAVQ